MVSGTLNRETDEIEKVRRALGNAASAPSTRCRRTRRAPRSIAAAEQARERRADLIVTIGGGSITDGAKAVQLCLANDIRTPEATRRPRGQARRRREARRRCAQISRADDAVGRRVLRHRRRHRRAHQGQGAVPPSRHHSARRDPRSRGDACTRRSGCSCRPASAPSITASRASARTRRTRSPTPRRCTGCRCWRAACRG